MKQITIPLSLAASLKKAGLIWQADINDFFGIPDRGLDERVFVISDFQANLDVFRGWPVVTFHGTAEWALDYILTSEVVWLPTEGQLRQELAQLLLGHGFLSLQQVMEDTYRCEITWQDESYAFTAPTAAIAYGQAILYLLEQKAAV